MCEAENKTKNNLKSADIVVVSIQSTHAIYRSDVWVSAEKRNTEADIGLNFVRAKHAEIPTYDGSPVMSHKENLLDTQRVNKRNEITHYVKAVVAAD